MDLITTVSEVFERVENLLEYIIVMSTKIDIIAPLGEYSIYLAIYEFY